MLQRYQSIFLLLAGACAALPFFLPAATTSGSANNSYLFSDSNFTLSDDSLLMVCFGLAALLWLADIFLFKNRIMQIRLSTISLLLVVVGSAYGAYLFSQDSGQAQAASAPRGADGIARCGTGSRIRRRICRSVKRRWECGWQQSHRARSCGRRIGAALPRGLSGRHISRYPARSRRGRPALGLRLHGPPVSLTIYI